MAGHSWVKEPIQEPLGDVKEREAAKEGYLRGAWWKLLYVSEKVEGEEEAEERKVNHILWISVL